MFQYHPLHPLLVRDKCAQDTYTQALCHTLGVWIITRIYWMVVFAPHSIKSFFIGLLINGSAMMGKDEGRRGLERTGSNWNHGMSAGAGPGWAATLSDEPPEAVGGEMNGWTPSFSQHRNERESESVRGRVRHTFPAQEDDAQQDSRLPSNTKSSLSALLSGQVEMRWRWGGRVQVCWWTRLLDLLNLPIVMLCAFFLASTQSADRLMPVHPEPGSAGWSSR